MRNESIHRSLIAAGALLGIGMGGFVDGIVLHQLLQVHNMLSAQYPTRGLAAEKLVVNLEINMFWDGLFHTFTWIMSSLGLALLWNTFQRGERPLSTKAFLGSLALGWGLFNLVEGIINHHLLHIHHVVETHNHLVWDLVFLASGLLLIGFGLAMIRAGRRDVTPETHEA
jgi:uncharacterized membrane protein